MGFLDLLPHERLFFQAQHLLLIAMIHCCLAGQNGVVVAIVFHPLSDDVGGVLHCDELSVCQLCDVLITVDTVRRISAAIVQ